MKKKWLGVALDIYDTPDNGRNLVASNRAITYWRDLLENEFGFEHIDTKNNKPIKDKNATKANVLSALNKMVLEATKDDVHVFVFVGHGDFQDDKYSVIRDEILFNSHDHHDEKILLFGSDQITDDELRAILNKNHKKGLFIFIFDCCYSGNIRTNKISKQEYQKIEYEKTIEIINEYTQLQSIKSKANILQDNLIYKDNTIPNVIMKQNCCAEKQEDVFKMAKNIAISKQNIRSSLEVLVEKHPSFWFDGRSNKFISKDLNVLEEISAIQKNIIDLHSRLYTRNIPVEINVQQNEILLCSSSAYKKTYQPKIDGEYQSAFSYLLTKNIKEHLEKETLLDYETLLKVTIDTLKNEDIYSYPQLILSETSLSRKQIFTK